MLTRQRLRLLTQLLTALLRFQMSQELLRFLMQHKRFLIRLLLAILWVATLLLVDSR